MVGLVCVMGSHPAPPNAVRSYGIRSTPPPDDWAPAVENDPDPMAPSVTATVSTKTAVWCSGRRAMSCSPGLLARGGPVRTRPITSTNRRRDPSPGADRRRLSLDLGLEGVEAELTEDVGRVGDLRDLVGVVRVHGRRPDDELVQRVLHDVPLQVLPRLRVLLRPGTQLLELGDVGVELRVV